MTRSFTVGVPLVALAAQVALVAVFSCVLAATDASLSNAQEPDVRVQLLVPAYFYPADDGLKHWDRLIAAASARVPILAIVNPASGPGKAADPAYTKLLDRATTNKSLTLLGYIGTSYSKRPIAEVKADVARWVQLYPQIQGVFFDEQASGADKVDYYAALHEYTRKERKLQRVVTNPGMICAEVPGSTGDRCRVPVRGIRGLRQV
jgi:Spherulation-specific family 4